jgi:hypothetical protein
MGLTIKLLYIVWILFALFLYLELRTTALFYLNSFRIAFPVALPVIRRPTRLVIFVGLPLETAWKSPSRRASL